MVEMLTLSSNTGNVMIDPRYLASPEDLTIHPSILTTSTHINAWKTLAQTAQQHGTPAILQLSHPGRQSAAGAGKRSFMEKTIAPSALPLNFGQGVLARLVRAVVYGTPREMGQPDIEAVVVGFVNAAKVAKEAGFKGVEIHAANGYLLGRFDRVPAIGPICPTQANGLQLTSTIPQRKSEFPLLMHSLAPPS
jgi:2,4-dienoyl-CoA reductase-like NADH-dependent reductase (Old Yellow Enzyme family)